MASRDISFPVPSHVDLGGSGSQKRLQIVTKKTEKLFGQSHHLDK